jgi:hypothetical protein
MRVIQPDATKATYGRGSIICPVFLDRSIIFETPTHLPTVEVELIGGIRCYHCKKYPVIEEGEEPLKRCEACDSGWHCSTLCQRANRQGHKRGCPVLAESGTVGDEHGD